MTIETDNLHASEIIYTQPAEIPRGASKHGRFLFSAYGCALMERRMDGGAYVYTAVNLSTEKTEILSRRKLRLCEDAFIGMAARISTLPIRGDSRFTIDKNPGDQPDSARLTETARRIFTDILPLHGYTLREKQLELAEHILDVIGRRGISLAESEVGTGKTHAYLVAALLAKRGRLNDFWLRGRYSRQSWAESAHTLSFRRAPCFYLILQPANVCSFVRRAVDRFGNYYVNFEPLKCCARIIELAPSAIIKDNKAIKSFGNRI